MRVYGITCVLYVSINKVHYHAYLTLMLAVEFSITSNGDSGILPQTVLTVEGVC